MMKGLLFEQSKRSNDEEIAKYEFNKIMEKCKKAARYGRTELIVEASMNNKHLHDLLIKEDLLVKTEGRSYYLSWNIPPEEVKMPLITTRDLIELGLPVDKFGIILSELRMAKAKKEVANTLQAEIIWVKKIFINENKHKSGSP